MENLKLGSSNHVTSGTPPLSDLPNCPSCILRLPSSGFYPNHSAMTGTRSRKALIIGAGPVGALTALSLDNRGWDVEVWESRDGEPILLLIRSSCLSVICETG